MPQNRKTPKNPDSPNPAKTPESPPPPSLAREIELAHNDHPGFKEIHLALQTTFLPVGAIESFFVLQMANAQWRLQRVARVESAFLSRPACIHSHQGQSENEDFARSLGSATDMTQNQKVVAALRCQEAGLQRAYTRALQYLRASQARRTPC